MSIFTSKKVWKFFINIQLTKSDPKRTRGGKCPPSCQLGLKECSFRNGFTPIVCLFRARASVPQATICSLASPSAMQKNRSLNATIQLLVGTATEITHATRRNLSAEQGCRNRYCLAGPEAYLFEYFAK